NLGGFDVFSSQGHQENWSKPSNMGSPINSSADDYYYNLLANVDRGYLVSNRLYGLDKIVTTHEDIFMFYPKEQMASIKGKVIDQKENKEVIASEIALYEQMDNGQERLLKIHMSDNGQYTFDLIAGKTYRLEVSKAGYQTAEYPFDTYDDRELALQEKDFYMVLSTTVASREPGQPIYENLEKTRVRSSQNREVTRERPRPQNTAAPAQTPTSRLPYIQYTPKHEGVYYKVQFASVIQYNPYDPLFKRIQEMGRLDTEYLIGKGWTRVLLAEFFTRQEALSALATVRQNGFPDAFLVKYRDGNRVTP
ncbi:MAG: hypothetical protein AAFP19_09265, partial [Bacteroidota bacterium]